jgi:uncharacterized protein
LLILLPPSETKRSGGVGISIDKLAIIWAALDPYRGDLFSRLETLCRNPELAARALKLGKNPQQYILANLSLRTSPTMPALDRYTGVLFEGLDSLTLSAIARERASEKLFIQSALFGLLPATEMIPNYKFSADAKLPGVNLKAVWRKAHEAVWPRLVGPVLDLRSKAYVELNPVPNDRESYFVDVLADSGRALNHFNKKAKGVFVRHALEGGLESIEQVPEIAKTAGFHAEVDGQSVRITVPKTF